MASFYSILGFMSVNSFEYSEPGSFDILSRLPLEMALTVLRFLTGKDLLNVARVSRKWLRICKSDRFVRQKIRRYIRKTKRANLALRMYGIHTDANRRDDARPIMIRNIVNTQEVANSNRVEQPTHRYTPYSRDNGQFQSAARPTRSRQMTGHTQKLRHRFRM